jgi:signal transduction histidine kinase
MDMQRVEPGEAVSRLPVVHVPVSSGVLTLGFLVLIAAVVVCDRRHRNAEARLRLIASRSQTMLAALPDAVLVLTADGLICEQHARGPVGVLRSDGPVGHKLRSVARPEVAAALEKAIARAAQSTAPCIEECGSGESPFREFEVRVVRYGLDQFLAIVRDITDSKHVQRALEVREAEVRQIHSEKESLAGRLLVAQEVERRRIARDLHDDLGQKLALLAIEVDAFKAAPPPEDGRLERLLRWLSDSIAEISSDVHGLSHRLHPARLETLGLVTSIDSLCRDIADKHGIDVDFRRVGEPPPRHDHVSLHLYRIVQEALHNVVKHSWAQHVLVELSVSQQAVDLRVVDHGRGFQMNGRTSEGLGLVSMRERARLAGGQISIQSAPGCGTSLNVSLPLFVERRTDAVGAPYRRRAEDRLAAALPTSHTM